MKKLKVEAFTGFFNKFIYKHRMTLGNGKAYIMSGTIPASITFFHRPGVCKNTFF